MWKAKNKSDMLSHTEYQQAIRSTVLLSHRVPTHTGYEKHSSLECRGGLWGHLGLKFFFIAGWKLSWEYKWKILCYKYMFLFTLYASYFKFIFLYKAEDKNSNLRFWYSTAQKLKKKKWLLTYFQYLEAI